jgi:hypothetical protein
MVLTQKDLELLKELHADRERGRIHAINIRGPLDRHPLPCYP